MAYSLKESINNYVKKINHKFKLDEICRYIEINTDDSIPNLENRIENFLTHCQYVFYNVNKDFYLPRSVYFKGSRFLISPTGEEIYNRFLIPGHRFIPFGDISQFPAEYTLLTEGGKEIPRKKIKKRVGELFIYLTLLDLFTLPDYLIYDDDRNSELFRHEDVRNKYAYITVFDMQDFFHENGFGQGDALLLEVDNWEKCFYKIRYLPAADRQKDEAVIKKWVQKLDNSFARLFSEEGIHVKMDEQISQAYYNAGKFLISNPCIHLGGYLDRSQLVSITPMGEKHVLWFDGKKPGPEDIIMLGEMTGTFESLDEILKDINCPFSVTEMEAFMRNEFYNRTAELDRVLEQCFELFTIQFFDEYQEKWCFKYIRELWARISREYNLFTDQVRGRIRKRALDIFLEFSRRFREIESKFTNTSKTLSPDYVLEITRILKGIFSILGICNEESATAEEEEERITEILDATESEIDWVAGEIEEQLKPALVLVRGQGKENQMPSQIYTLKISIKEATPPIWRRVRIPGNYTLGELHLVIQELFGWGNYHLHEFHINRVAYGIPDEDQWSEIVDENSVDLAAVITNEKQKFLYIYDFGDDWKHQVLVEKIIPAEEIPVAEREKAVCLAGKRACPPEDCGGIWGYMDLLEALKDKNHPEHAEFAEWLGDDFDPEFFSLEKVNQLLSK